jgi:hypothetical protein
MRASEVLEGLRSRKEKSNHISTILDLEKKSSHKIPFLPHAASFNTEAEGGRMVKEWDFEAGFFF